MTAPQQPDLPPLPEGWTLEEANYVLDQWIEYPNPALLTDSTRDLLPWLEARRGRLQQRARAYSHPPRENEDGLPSLPAGVSLGEALRIFRAWVKDPECLLEEDQDLLPWLRAKEAALRKAGQENDEAALESKAETIAFEKRAGLRADKIARELEDAKLPPVVIRNGSWLSAQHFDPLVCVIPGIAPEGVTFLAGGPKTGKSWFVLSGGLSAAAGTEILGTLPAQPARPVLYMALEDSDRRMKDRCGLLGWQQIPELFEYVTAATPDQTLQTAWEWLWKHRGRRPLVIIDTWGKIVPPALRGETIYERDYRLGTKLQQLAGSDPGTSVWVVHHTRKQGAEDFLDTMSGTQGVAGSCDAVLVLARKRGESAGILHVTGRDVDEETYRLCGFPHWELDGGSLSEASSRAQAASDRERLGDRSTAILDRIRQDGQVTTAEVAGMLGTTSDIASKYLGRLASSGAIVRAGRGVYVSPVMSVGSVGSVGNPDTPDGGYMRARGPTAEQWAEMARMADRPA